MQTPAFLWFELQVEQQRRPETFAESNIPVKAGNLNSPSRVGTRRCASVKPVQLRHFDPTPRILASLRSEARDP
jgi:hypothetical protein